MPMCKAFKCRNCAGRCNKSFFTFPDPKKSIIHENLCKLWINNLRNPELDFQTFEHSRSTVVCEDHFEDVDFRKRLKPIKGKITRKRLIHGSVPKPYDDAGSKSVHNTTDHILSLEAKLNIECSKNIATSPVCDVSQVEDLSTEVIQDWNESTPSDFLSLPDSLPEDVPIFTATKLCQEDPTPMRDETPHMKDGISMMSCGHACLECHKPLLDHAYALPKVYKDSSTQTEEESTSVINDLNIIPANSIKYSTPSRKCLALPSYIPLDEDADFSKEISIDWNNSRDETFHTDMCESDSDFDQAEEMETPNIVEEPKYIIFESCLQELLNLIHCPLTSCKAPLCKDELDEVTEGSSIRLNLSCANGHLIERWSSQPTIGRMAAGNLLISASILFSGLSFGRVEHLANFMGLQFFSKTTFNCIQRDHLMPVVLNAWHSMQGALLEKIKASDRPLRLAGDGRCDSPGYSAKYCTYSLMDLETNEILGFVVVCVTETGSSSRMEVEGFRKCLNMLLDNGFKIVVLATDCHVQIRSFVKREHPDINHQFDVWHLAKNIKKKLTAKANVKGAEELHQWIKAVTNHLWWCASNCDGNMDWMEECWTSIVHHCVNIHTFDGDHVNHCQHPPIPEDLCRKKKWLKLNSKAHNSLKDVVLNKRLRKDIRQLSEFCHTGSLEVYHSLMTKYIPKRQEFDFDQMETRTALVAIDHNSNVARKQKLGKDGPVFRFLCPKATGQWVAKPVYEDKSYLWVKDLLLEVVNQKYTHDLPPTTVKKRPNIAPIPAPHKPDLVCNLKTRF